MQNRSMLLLALVCSLPALSGCPKGNVDAKAGNQAEAIQDYDTALMHYERALKSDPTNSEFRLKETRIRFEDGQYHVQQGQKARQRGDLQTALSEFQRAAATDPSSPIAAEELQRTAQMIAEANATNAANNPPPAPAEGELLAAAPQLAPLKGPLPPIHMTNNPRTLYETIAQIAGITVVFDPAWTPQNKSIRVDLPTASLADALNIVALESHSFWTPVSDKIVMVAEENAAKRKEFENEVVKFFYLTSPLADTDLTDIVNAIRQTIGAANISHIQPVKSINAIVMRETPDKIAVAQRIINAIDKAKPEVVVDVKVLTASRDLIRNLGINPGGTATVTFAPPGTTTTSGSGTGTGTGTGSGAASTATLTLQQLKHLSSADYSVSLPSATINALFTDNRTQMIQEPQVRSIDGEKATVNIGSRVPIATGSFQAGTGVGVASAASLVSPLVNTQFQYQNVGVNVDVTPHIHPNNDITLKLRVEISAVASTQNLGGIQQPVFSQNVIDHTVDLKDGEVSVLGGFIQKQDTNNISGWPGLAKIPILRYIFSSEDAEHQENELLLVLIPHIVRVPLITPADMQTFASGTDTNIQVRPLLPASPAIANAPAAQLPPAATPNAAVQPMTGGQSSLHFEPAVASLKVGQTMALGIVVQGVNDLFSIPMLLQYDPKVISIEEVRDGGFFNNDPTQIGAIVQRIDQEHGQAVISATRMPNTPGVSGTGTLVGIMVKGLAPGDSKISIVQVNAHDSQQRPITLATNEATVHVQQ